MLTAEELTKWFQTEGSGIISDIVARRFDAYAAEHRLTNSGLPTDIANLLANRIAPAPRPFNAAPGIPFARKLMMEVVKRRRGVDPIEYFSNLYKGRDENWTRFGAGVDSNAIESGGAMLEQQISLDFIESLRAANPIEKLKSRRMRIDGTLPIPGISAAALSRWIGEARTKIKARRANFITKEAKEKSLGVILAIHNKWLDRALPGADEFVRQDAIADCNSSLGAGYISGPGTQYTPRGLLNWVPAVNTFAANATFNSANAAFDLGKAVSLVNDGLKRDIVAGGWLMPIRVAAALRSRNDSGVFPFREEMYRGMLEGYPVVPTAQIAYDGTNGSPIIFADFDTIVTGDPRIRIDTSSDGTVTDDEGNSIDAFAEDYTLVRVILEGVDLIPRHDTGIAVISACKWAGA
jgi:HK97 family phage major capsid protein